MEQSEKVRIDKYLWAIRLFKTRRLATEACDKGRVKLNDESIKASRSVKLGEEYEVKTENKRWRIRIKGIIGNRVAYPVAIEQYEDITPAEELQRIEYQAAVFHSGKRPTKIGRPTKKERRELDDFLDEGET